MCFFKSPALRNDLPQYSHLWSLWPSWTVWTVDVPLQTNCLRNYLATGFTFMIFETFMNCLRQRKWFATRSYLWSTFMKYVNVSLHTTCSKKWFATRFTFMILMAIMNCMNVSVQNSWLRHWFITKFTYVIFVAFMNCVNMLFSSENDLPQSSHL